MLVRLLCLALVWELHAASKWLPPRFVGAVNCYSLIDCPTCLSYPYGTCGWYFDCSNSAPTPSASAPSTPSPATFAIRLLRR